MSILINNKIIAGSQPNKEIVLDDLSYDLRKQVESISTLQEAVDNIASMPIGTIYSLDCTKDYVPEGSLPTDGTEYTSPQFTYLWNNYLTGEIEYINSDWTTATAGSATWYSITYANGKFVAVGYGAAVSTDGESWATATIGGTTPWNGITYGNGKFVAVGVVVAAISTDGESWATATIGAVTWNGITYGNGKFVAVGADGSIATSTDGESWTTITVGSSDWYSITYANGKFVAVGAAGSIATSTDGESWTTATVGLSDWNGITYANGKFVAVGYGAAVSTDGESWATATIGGTTTWNGITYGNGKFVAVGFLSSSCSMATSTDGESWTTITVGSSDWYSITYANGKFVAVGADGSIASCISKLVIRSRLNTCTYDEYAADLATYGQCVKFAVDITNNTFKVPTIKDGAVIQQALSDSELGKAYNAGVPNLYGKFGTGQNDYFDGVLFTQGENIKDDANAGGSTDTSAIFDASKYNPIYGNSDTVQMNAVALRYFVVVANGSINQSQMDWSQWASNLQAKANKDGTNWEASVRNVDGQWVSKAAILTQAVTAGVTTIDMSEYLPNDNYQYEVLILVSVGDTGTNMLRVYSDIIPVSTLGLDLAANGIYNGSYITLPVGIGRRIYQSLDAAAISDDYRGIEALAYRRLGTNQ